MESKVQSATASVERNAFHLHLFGVNSIFNNTSEALSAKSNRVPQKSFDEELGKYFADHRRGLSISQEFLADILRRDQTFVSKVETGKRTLSLFEFIRWARALNLSN